MSCSRRERARPARPVFVEFVGTPGSGKTTLSLRLIERLAGEGIAAGSVVGAARDHAARTRLGAVMRLAPATLRRPLLWRAFHALASYHAVRFFFEHRALMTEVFGFQLERPLPVATKWHILYWFFQLAGRRRFLGETARPGEIIVFDDGFLHRSVHLNASHAEAPDLGRVNSYVDRIPAPDVVVHATARRDLCERRVVERGVWRHSRGLSRAELGRYIERADIVAAEAVRHARERGWAIVEIPTDGAPEETAAALAEAVSAVARTVRPVAEVPA